MQSAPKIIAQRAVKGYKSDTNETKKCVNYQSTTHGSDEKRKCPQYKYQIKKLLNKIEYNQNDNV